MDATQREILGGRWKIHKERADAMLLEAHNLTATTPPTSTSCKQARQLIDAINDQCQVLTQLDQQLIVHLEYEEIDQFCEEAGAIIDDLDSAVYYLKDMVSQHAFLFVPVENT